MNRSHSSRARSACFRLLSVCLAVLRGEDFLDDIETCDVAETGTFAPCQHFSGGSMRSGESRLSDRISGTRRNRPAESGGCPPTSCDRYWRPSRSPREHSTRCWPTPAYASARLSERTAPLPCAGRMYVWPSAGSLSKAEPGASRPRARVATCPSLNRSTKKLAAHTVAFRHTFAVHAIRARLPLPRLQKLLGHATPAMTMRYARHAPEAYFALDAARIATSLSGTMDREAEAVRPAVLQRADTA